MPTSMTFNSLQDDMRSYAERAFTAASDPLVYAQLPSLINMAERRCATELKVQGFVRNVVANFAAGVNTYDKPDRWREWISINLGDAEPFEVASRSAVAGTRTLVLARPHPFAAGDSILVSGVGGTGYDGTFTLTAVAQLSITYVSGATTEGSTATTGIVSEALEERQPLLPRSYEYIRGYWPDPRLTDFPLFYSDYDYYHFIVAPTPDRPYPFELNYYELPALLDSGNQTNWLTDIAPNLLLYAALLEMGPFLKNPEATGLWQAQYDRAAQALTGQDMDKLRDRTSERTKP